MSFFNEAFMFLSDEAPRSARGERRGRLARTSFVPVTDAAMAATVAQEMSATRVDLIELYGGLGAAAAAAVFAATNGQVPIGVTTVRAHPPGRSRAAIFVAADAATDLAAERYVHEDRAGRMTIVAIPDPAEAPHAARTLVAEGATQVSLCGVHGLLAADAVLEAVGDRASVDAVLFGAESLASVVAYSERYEHALKKSVDGGDPS